jgi:hypothetical protein
MIEREDRTTSSALPSAAKLGLLPLAPGLSRAEYRSVGPLTETAVRAAVVSGGQEYEDQGAADEQNGRRA